MQSAHGDFAESKLADLEATWSALVKADRVFRRASYEVQEINARSPNVERIRQAIQKAKHMFPEVSEQLGVSIVWDHTVHFPR